jgi:Flp pilus assembly CpaF family ATPase
VRFESLALAAGLNREGLHAQLNSGIQYIIHISRTSEAKRIISSIGRCELDDKGFVKVKNICTFDGINTKTSENLAA